MLFLVAVMRVVETDTDGRFGADFGGSKMEGLVNTLPGRAGTQDFITQLYVEPGGQGAGAPKDPSGFT